MAKSSCGTRAIAGHRVMQSSLKTRTLGGHAMIKTSNRLAQTTDAENLFSSGSNKEGGFGSQNLLLLPPICSTHCLDTS